MPDYCIAERMLDIRRDAVLVDTNVLVRAFAEYTKEDQNGNTVSAIKEGERDYARFLIYEDVRPLFVSISVIVEAWGMIVGKLGDRQAGREMFLWLNSPGQVTILPYPRSTVGEARRLMELLSVDCVDAMLADMATDITNACGLRPALSIATFDTRDFTRMSAKHGLNLRILDMHSYDEYDPG